MYTHLRSEDGLAKFGQPGAKKSAPLSLNAWRAPATITNASVSTCLLQIQSTGTTEMHRDRDGKKDIGAEDMQTEKETR